MKSQNPIRRPRSRPSEPNSPEYEKEIIDEFPAETSGELQPRHSELRHNSHRYKRQSPKKPDTVSKGPDTTSNVSFMHPSERELAGLLDFYGIKYLYEPRSFPLRWDGDRVIEMFSPDFYLPEQDQYLELTTMKQRLVTEKNRKLHRLQKMYPEINITLLYRKDYLRLLGKYGYGELANAEEQGVQRMLFSQVQIQERVQQIGQQISSDYRDLPLVLIGVLKGVVPFLADLIRAIEIPLDYDTLAISRYGNVSSRQVEITKDLEIELEGRHVLIVEDIVDTGLTLRYLLNHLSPKGASSVEVCSLLDKPVRRIGDMPIKYCGFEISDEFVVGYGLDYQGRHRNLPYIGILKPSEPPSGVPLDMNLANPTKSLVDESNLEVKNTPANERSRYKLQGSDSGVR